MRAGARVHYRGGILYWYIERVLPNGRLVIRCITGGRALVVSSRSVTEV